MRYCTHQLFRRQNMKRIISLIVALVMICAIGVTAAGCNKSGGNGKTTSGSNKLAASGVPAGLEGVTEDEIAALTNTGKVTVYDCLVGGASWSFEDKKRGEWLAGFKKYFQDSYGGEASIISKDWNNWEKNFLTEYAAGTAPMLVYLFERNWPMFANRSLVYNVKELEEKGVKCLNSPVLSENLKAIQKIYTYNKNTYTFAATMVEPDMIFVNEDLYADLGVKSPSAYYKEGKWNLDTFFKCAKAVTKDTDNDGKTDQYGYYGWDDNFFVGTNGGQLVSLDENGKLKVTMDDTKVKNAFANIQHLTVTDKSYKKDTSGKWEDGKLGMIAWMPRNEINNLKSRKFKVSMIPFPLGQDNTTGVHTCKAYAWSVAKTAKDVKEMQAGIGRAHV